MSKYIKIGNDYVECWGWKQALVFIVVIGVMFGPITWCLIFGCKP